MSKFGALRDAKNRTAEPESKPVAPPSPAPVKTGPGSRGGKKNDPEYMQATAYVRKTTYKRVDATLRQADRRGQFSALVEELLSEWLDKQPSGRPDV